MELPSELRQMIAQAAILERNKPVPTMNVETIKALKTISPHWAGTVYEVIDEVLRDIEKTKRDGREKSVNELYEFYLSRRQFHKALFELDDERYDQTYFPPPKESLMRVSTAPVPTFRRLSDIMKKGISRVASVVLRVPVSEPSSSSITREKLKVLACESGRKCRKNEKEGSDSPTCHENFSTTTIQTHVFCLFLRFPPLPTLTLSALTQLSISLSHRNA